MSTAKTEEQRARKRERDRKYRERKRVLKAESAKPQTKKPAAKSFAVRIKLPKKAEVKPAPKAKKPVKTAKAKPCAKKGLSLEKRVAVAAVALRALALFLTHD